LRIFYAKSFEVSDIIRIFASKLRKI